jgi:hypothetical protein
MCLTYTCCSATNSLCNACLGSTSENSTGRKRSVLLLTLAVAIALWFQYDVGPAIVTKSGWFWKAFQWIPGFGKMLYHAWYDSCEVYKDNDALLQQCAGNAGVYRPTFVASLFFAVLAIVTKVEPYLNKEVWPAKYVVFLFAVTISMFVSSAPMFTGFYLWLARFGATLFVLLQQIILIDVAYNWNEDWVDRADQADRMDYGSGANWLHAIVATCVAFYVAACAGIWILYQNFTGCPENTWIITLTMLGVLGLTAIQLSGQEGSLLTSSVMSLYSVYLAYSMVSKNPNASCNPQLGSNDVWSIVIGLTLTAVSLAWTGWSWTAEERLNVDGVQSAKSVTGAHPIGGNGQINLDVPFLDAEDQPRQGLVTDSDGPAARSGRVANAHVWKLNVVMLLISCFVAMTLTGWGTIEELDENANAANPTVGRVNMAMLGISQWLAIGLYVWTLLAPRLYPDYEFS